MREVCHAVRDIDRHLEDAARAKQQLDAERWREQVRPRAMRLFAARTAKLHGSRALLKLLVEELYPDDLFTELVGDLARPLGAEAVPVRHLLGRTSPPGREPSARPPHGQERDHLARTGSLERDASEQALEIQEVYSTIAVMYFLLLFTASMLARVAERRLSRVGCHYASAVQ